MSKLRMVFQVFIGDSESSVGGDDYGQIEDHMNCEDNAEAAVNDALQAIYRDEEIWNSDFGSDELSAEVKVVVTEPAEIAGTYQVDLERVVVAHARRVVP